MDDKYLKQRIEDLNLNSAVVTPVCIVIDISHSMNDGKFRDRHGKKRIERVKEGIDEFLEEIRRDDILSDSVSIAFVAFNTEVHEIHPFSNIDSLGEITIPTCSKSGDTPKGVDFAMSLLEREKKFLKDHNKKYYQPWIVIMSDGRATPGAEMYIPGTKDKDFTDINRRLDNVQSKIKRMEAGGKLTVIPVLISESNDGEYENAKKQMQDFTIMNRCRELGDGESFKEFFKILGRSVSASINQGVNNSDMIFARAPRSDSARREDVGAFVGNDFPAQPESQRYTERESVKREDVGVSRDDYTVENAFTNGNYSAPVLTKAYSKADESGFDDADEVARLEKESQKVHTGAVESYDGGYEMEDEHPEDVFRAPGDEVAPTVATDVTKNDSSADSYLKQLLEGLDDWDDI